MNTTDMLSGRDRAVLRAVAAGRCRLSAASDGRLIVDDLGCCDQFIGRRLTKAGLITASEAGAVRLTPAGAGLLDSSARPAAA